MAGTHNVHVSHGDPAFAGDPSLGNALERVFEAQQTLVVSRVELLFENLTAQAREFVSISIRAILGSILALAGWFIAIAGVIDVLDDYFARFAVEIALGVLHVGAGLAIALYRSRRSEVAPS